MPLTRDPAELVELARDGHRRALARLLSMVERGGDEARRAGQAAHPHRSGTPTVGITGSPGAGKSTLTSAVVAALRRHERRVAVLAIDPSSPFTGGAILGDRVRMQEHATDEGVFIRSMATRGHLGGLSLATPQAVRVLDAAGWPEVLIETVGVGQVEVDIAGAADTTVVVVNPGWGDSVQANKAGLMEIADVFVINKADRVGTDDTERDLLQMLELSPPSGWRPPIVRTVATQGTGVEDLIEAVDAHRRHLADTGELQARRHQRITEELSELVTDRVERRIAEELADRGPALGRAIAAGDLDPWSAADELFAQLSGNADGDSSRS